MWKRAPLLLTALFLSACDQSADGGAKTPAPTPKTSVRKVKTPDAAAPEVADATEPAPVPEATPATPKTAREKLELALAEKDPEVRESVVEAVAWENMDADPEFFKEVLAKLPPESPSAQRLLFQVAIKKADHDLEGAVAIALSLKDPAQKQQLIERIAVDVSEQHPTRAAEIVSRHLPVGPDQQRCAVQVLSLWAGQEPASAAAWVATFPEGKARSEGIDSVVFGWLNTDAESLSTWIESDKAKPMRTEAVAALRKHIQSQAPEQRERSMTLFAKVAGLAEPAPVEDPFKPE